MVPQTTQIYADFHTDSLLSIVFRLRFGNYIFHFFIFK